jgi:HPt (histidine-containing phosphotransfer) domain-containing protein
MPPYDRQGTGEVGVHTPRVSLTDAVAGLLRRLAPLSAVLFAVMVVLGCGLAAVCWFERERALQDARQETARSASFIADALDQSLHRIDRATRIAAAGFERLPPQSGARVLAARMLLTAASAGMPDLALLAFIEEDGRLLARTPVDLEISDSIFAAWTACRQDPSPGPQLRVDDGHVTWSRRINRPNGRFAGAVIAELDMDYVRLLDRGERENAADRVALLRRDGTVLAVIPDAGEAEDSEVGFELIQAIGVGVFDGTVEERDGEMPRVLSYRSSQQFPIIVVVQRPWSAIDRAWILAVLRWTIVASLIAAPLLVLTWRLWNQDRAHVAGARALSKPIVEVAAVGDVANTNVSARRDAPVLVWSDIERLCARIGRTEVEQILELTRTHLDEAMTALPSAQGTTLLRLCHDVASVAGSAGLHQLANVARRIEQALCDEEADVAAAIPRLVAAIQEAQPALTAVRAQLRSKPAAHEDAVAEAERAGMVPPARPRDR